MVFLWLVRVVRVTDRKFLRSRKRRLSSRLKDSCLNASPYLKLGVWLFQPTQTILHKVGTISDTMNILFELLILMDSDSLVIPAHSEEPIRVFEYYSTANSSWNCQSRHSEIRQRLSSPHSRSLAVAIVGGCNRITLESACWLILQ